MFVVAPGSRSKKSAEICLGKLADFIRLGRRLRGLAPVDTGGPSVFFYIHPAPLAGVCIVEFEKVKNFRWNYTNSSQQNR